MKRIFLTIILIASCSMGKKDSKENNNTLNNLTEIEISGTSINRKGGAVVDSKSIQFWIDGINSWDDKYLDKKVIVKGLLEIREDNPVFVDNSEIKSQGIPVSNELEVQKQKKRFWILNPKVKLIEKL